MNNTHTGACHCGQIKYQFTSSLTDIAHCHCSTCRRTTGGIVTSWITTPLETFQWSLGTPAKYQSSDSCTRYFCQNCGAHLALFTTLSPTNIDVTIATLARPEYAPAERHIWVKSRLPWLHLDESLPEENEELL